jgi:phosphoglycolate phosphatase
VIDATGRSKVCRLAPRRIIAATLDAANWIFLIVPLITGGKWYSADARTRVVKTVLFDFDFTLADSSAGVVECTNYALRMIRLSEADELAILRTVGLALPVSFQVLSGRTDALLSSDFTRRFVERADEVMADLTTLYPPVPAVLRALHQLTIQVGVVSTKFRYRIQEILRRASLLSLVDAIIGGEDVSAHKPNPSCIVTALAALKTPAADAIYVGDHPVDALAAQAAGVRFVGVLTGTTDRNAFAEVGVSDILRSVEDLPSHIATRCLTEDFSPQQ